MAWTVDPAKETADQLAKKLKTAIENQEEAMRRMERLISNRRRNVAEGSHQAELNIGNIAVEIARYAQEAHCITETLQFHRMLTAMVEHEVAA
jgi:hypothetical protein